MIPVIASTYCKKYAVPFFWGGGGGTLYNTVLVEGDL